MSGRRAAVRAVAALSLASVALSLSWVLALSLGTESTSIARAIADASSLDRTLLLRARLPRVLLASLAGAGLSMVGAAFQGLLHNPLAEPYVLGVSGGAALGASVAIALGVSATTALGASALPIFALVGGLAATALVFRIARGAGPGSGTTMLLSGVIVNALASALITFLKTLVSAAKAQELLFWLMGFLDVPSPASLGSVAVLVPLGGAMMLADAGRLNLIALGEGPARSLGVDVRALERRMFFAASVVVGAIVCVTGLISFVGLVVPHTLRRLVGADHRLLLPLSAIAGAAALVLCDLVSRLAFRVLGTEPPVGAITALVGAPMFLLALSKRR